MSTMEREMGSGDKRPDGEGVPKSSRVASVWRALGSALWRIWERPLLGPPDGSGAEQPHPNRRAKRPGWLVPASVAICLAALAATTTHMRTSLFPPTIYADYGYGTDENTGPETFNLFFDSDVPSYKKVMVDRWTQRHADSNLHPLMSLSLFPPVRALRAVGLSELAAVNATMATVSGIWTALMFSLLFTWGCRVVDAAVFTVLAQTSASAMFWFTVPETYTLGSLTILAAFLLTLWPRNVPPLLRYTLATALTLTMTTTNAMFGLIASARRLATKNVWIVGASAWFLVCMLWAAQKRVFPTSQFFVPPPNDAMRFFCEATPLRGIQVLQGLLSHAIVMPDIQIYSDLGERCRPGTSYRMLSVERSWIGSGGALGLIASVAWLLLAALAVWAARSARSGLQTLCLFCGAPLLAFYFVYGYETFLYTMLVLPMLVVLAAGVTFTPRRRLGLALAGIVIAFGGVNNWQQFKKAAAIAHEVDAVARSWKAR